MREVSNFDELFKEVDVSLLKSFVKFHYRNLHVYEEFEKLSKEMFNSGRRKYSAWVIINIMRWNHDLKTSGGLFKISNNHIALYSRLFMYNNPECTGFFNIKPMKSHDIEDIEDMILA